MSTLYITQNQFIVCVVILLPTHHLFNYLNLIPASFFSGEEGRGGGTCRYLRENCVKNIVSDVTDDEPESNIECQVIEPPFIKDHFS